MASAMRSAPSPSSGSRALEPPSTTGATKRRDLVDLAGVEERAGQVRAALEQDRGDARGAELVERGAHAVGLVAARWRRSPRRRRPPARRSAAAARRGATTTVSGTSTRAAHELRVQRQAALGVEHDPPRLAHDAVDPRGQLRVVGQRGADPDRDRVALRAPAVRAQPRRPRPRSTSSRPVRVATLPSSVIADLNSTCGRPVRACLRNGWLSSRARAASSPSATTTSIALVAQDPEPAAGRLLGRVVGGDHDARDARPRGSRRCTAACGPWWQHGSSET